MGVRHSVFDRYRDSTLRLLYRWAIIIAYVGLMAPLVIVIVASFSKKRFFDFPPSLDSLGVLSYTQLIQHAELKRSLLLSVELAVTTMVVTMAISALAALRHRPLPLSGPHAGGVGAHGASHTAPFRAGHRRPSVH